MYARTKSERNSAAVRTRYERSSNVPTNELQRAYGSVSVSGSKEKENQEEFDLESAWLEFHAAYPPKGRSRMIDARSFYVERLAASPDPPALHALVMARIRERWVPSSKWAKGFVMREDEFVRQESWDEEPEVAEDDLGPMMRAV
jgi:hypothetical protein